MSKQRNRLLSITGIVLVLLGLTALSGCTSIEQIVGGPTMTPPPPGGTPVEPPIEIRDFTLTTQNGEPFGLSDLDGRPALFYFGYTYCPDVCPLTLADLRQVAIGLGDSADAVSVIFVSVDIQRDTPERLAEYMSAFNEDFIGLTTDDEANLDGITEDFGVFYELEDVPETQASYLVAHTASVFLVNEDGQLSMIYAYQTPPDVIVADLLDMLNAE